MTAIEVAGAIAEHVSRGDADFLTDEAIWWEEAIMSETDWERSGCSPGEPDAALMRAVAKVLNLLSGPLRAELYATARGLIVESREVAAAAA
jgi:hypothetical protein